MSSAAHARNGLFAPVDVGRHANAGPEAVVRRWQAEPEGPAAGGPRGRQRFWGVPFECPPEDSADAPGWVVAGDATAAVTVPLATQEAPRYLVALHACAMPEPPDPAGDAVQEALPARMTQLGRDVGAYVLEYADGSEHRQPLRYRYEINSLGGTRPFTARPQ